MNAEMGPIVLAAGDQGAQSALRPLADAMPSLGVYGSNPDHTRDDYWDALFRLQGARGLVCGTSDSLAGRTLEASARRAATMAGIPVVAIEDFPGNFYEIPGGPVDLLVVESTSVVTLTQRKLGRNCPQTIALGSARYDVLRHAAPSHRATLRDKGMAPDTPVSILWAGQPDTDDCVTTLRALAPILAARTIELLFKAHPRDKGYKAGSYLPLLGSTGIQFRDVTHLTVEEALLFAPRLVVTQFSSTAIEAGFYGIPSLNVLLPDAGGARLLEKNGFPTPPHCLEGAAAYVARGNELADALSRLLHDETARKSLMHCFDLYFRTDEIMLPHLVASIENLFQIKEFPT
jgi:hypothetical protein